MYKKLITLLAAVSLGACTQVDAGNVSVWTYYGKAEQKSYGPGFYWYNPWSYDVIEMDTRQLKWRGNTETYTKDIQKSDVKFVLNYHLEGSKAHIMYQRVGENWADNILPQTVLQAIKNEFGAWDAVRIVEHRGQVTDRIEHNLRAKLARQNIVLDSFDLVDIKYTGPFEHAVEQKQVAVQNAQAAQNKTVQTTEEAKQAVIKAKGEAEALSITSTALKGDPKLIELKAIEKWNGELPTYMTGPVPFVNVGNK